MATELILIRHGNAVRVNGTYLHAPLTPLGRQQATLTGQHLRQTHLPLGGFYTSPLRRARETADMIGAEIGVTAQVKDGIQEMEPLELPFLLLLEALAIFDPLDDYLEDRAGRRIRWPLEGRVSKVLTELVAMHPAQRVAVVAHSGVIASALARFFPEQRLYWWRTTVGNCSLTRIAVGGARPELLAVNETAHLSADSVTVQPPTRVVEVAEKVVQTEKARLPRRR